MKLKIKDTFNTQLPADSNKENSRRQVLESCFSFVSPKIPSNPKLIHTVTEVADLMGLPEKDVQSKEFLNIVTGAELLNNTNPYAMCYGGHQFGNWAGQLGDGRAINLTEINYNNQQWALQLKGAGATPYSRTADGLAVLRSSIREHLCSEAMHHLGVPTTRSLSLALSGDKVLRDVMYNGNAAYEKGAIVCRVSPSFIRFGNFEIFASRQDTETLKTLTNYTINQFYPEIKSGTKDGYLAFFNEVVNRTLEMVIHWQRVGFVHGVMNTDNMSILGLTIDYGPYGWLEGYDHDWTPNTTDHQFKRYRYGNQSQIALWNLLQLANALFPLIGDPKPLEEILHTFNSNYQIKYLKMMCQKLGLEKEVESDTQLIKDLENNLQLSETDMTIFFRNLANISKETQVLEDDRFLELIKDAFYVPDEIQGDILKTWKLWFKTYVNRLTKENLTDTERKSKMNTVNPKYVLRNYIAQLIIDDADKGNYSLLNEIHTLLKNPYAEQEQHQKWFAKRPEWARHKVGCSMLSCSS
ncbi:YdiU family protein [Flavobacteriaceae bacterium AU392]|nr:YdiU family protein [Flavobacteriaceae bacterium]RKM85895.1 YdiU family protein [Flavobacteriaceae bacterium AU392]